MLSLYVFHFIQAEIWKLEITNFREIFPVVDVLLEIACPVIQVQHVRNKNLVRNCQFCDTDFSDNIMQWILLISGSRDYI